MQIGKYRISSKVMAAVLAGIIALLKTQPDLSPELIDSLTEMIYTCWVYIGGKGAADLGMKLGQQLSGGTSEKERK